jgi:sugar phosphate isomerase/epimerase
MEFDELFFCGVPAVKWYANKFPEEDFIVLNNIKSILGTIKANKIILISTIDVYEYIDSKVNEDYDCDIFNNHTYGVNRYLFESFVKKTFDNHHIIRLPALFGKGLKKNIIYDLMNNNQVNNIEINTIFQWYDLKWLKNDIDIIIKNDIKICNLFTEPLETIEIIKLFDYPLSKFKTQSKLTYNLKTKYSELFDSSKNGYIRDKYIVLDEIKKYLDFEKINKNNLVISNICVKHISQFQLSCILKLFGIKNIQIAPTTLIGKWDNLNNLNFEIFNKNDINIYSFQSITFGLTDNIFDEKTIDSLFLHLTKVIDCALKYNVKVLVFGCPKNRKIINNDTEKNDEIFIKFFQKIGDYIGDNNLKLCIENNSKIYGCNYLNTINEVGDIVNKINHKNIKMMIDVGNAIMENDNLDVILNYSDIIYNIDIACENMKPFTNYNNLHKKFIEILNNINYDKKMNLEMILNTNNEENELELLRDSLFNFIRVISNINY